MLQKIYLLFHGIEIIFVYCNRLCLQGLSIKFKVYRIFFHHHGIIRDHLIETQEFLENILELIRGACLAVVVNIESQPQLTEVSTFSQSPILFCNCNFYLDVNLAFFHIIPIELCLYTKMIPSCKSIHGTLGSRLQLALFTLA